MPLKKRPLGDSYVSRPPREGRENDCLGYGNCLEMKNPPFGETEILDSVKVWPMASWAGVARKDPESGAFLWGRSYVLRRLGETN